MCYAMISEETLQLAMATGPKPTKEPYYTPSVTEDDLIDFDCYVEELPPSPRRSYIDIPPDTASLKLAMQDS
jgi:hypothetical protein